MSEKKFFEDALVPVPSLDLWAANNLQVSYVDQVEFIQRPSFIFNETSQICFEIPASMSNFTSPDLFLNCIIKACTVDAQGKEHNIDEVDDTITLTNFITHSLFSDVEMRCNGLTLTTKNSLYPYIAFLHEQHLSSKDEFTLKEGTALAHKYGAKTISGTKGPGQKKIREAIANGNSILLRDKLHVPLLTQQKSILNNCTITIILHQTSNTFRFIDKHTTRQVKIKIEDIYLSGTRLILLDALYISMMNKLKTSNAIYPIKRFLAEQVQVPTGTTTVSKNLSLTTSAVPDYLFIMYVPTAAVAGDKSLSPFESNISNIMSCQVNYEGRNFPNEPYNPSDGRDLLRIFSDYKNACKNVSENPMQYNTVTFEEFANDYGLIAIQLARYGGNSRDLQDDNLVSLSRAGVSVLNIRLAKAETTPKTLIIISFFRNKIFFNEAMIPTTDFTS